MTIATDSTAIKPLVFRRFPPEHLVNGRRSNPFSDSLFTRDVILLAEADQVAYRNIYAPFSIKCVLSGSESYMVDRAQRTVDPHHFLLINEHQEYSCIADGDRPVRSLSIFFRSGRFSDIAEHWDFRRTRIPDRPDAPTGSAVCVPTVVRRLSEGLGQHLRALVRLILSGEAAELAVEQQVLTMTTALADYLNTAGDDTDRLPQLRRAHREELCRRLHRARDRLHASRTEPWTISELARLASVSEYHFLRMFKRLFGLSPYQYLVRLRVERAMDLIGSGESLADAALLSGFSDQSHMCHAFKRVKGRSPGQFSGEQ